MSISRAAYPATGHFLVVGTDVIHHGVLLAGFWWSSLAMRLDKDKLAGRNLTASDVAMQHVVITTSCPWKVEGEFVIGNVYVNTDLTNVEEFKDMALATMAITCTFT